MEDNSCRIDFGHDDVDGKECKDGRSRTWMLLLYDEDPTHKAILDGKLFELDWNFAGRIHDADEGVKPHHHIVILFKDGRKNTDVANDLGIDKRWLRAWDRKKRALRYLCHRDNPEKYQYSTDAIYGTIAEQAVSVCSKGNEIGEAESVREIIRTLADIDGVVTYAFFLRLITDRGLYPVFRRMGAYGARLIDEHNYQYNLKLRSELQRKRDIEGFEELILSDSLPFDKCCEKLEKLGFKPNDLI